MNYEMAVLAALLQLEKPTNPMITETTGISSRKVSLAIDNLKDILDVDISWHGPKKTGYYCIDSWGAFESGKAIRRKALALDLHAYKSSKTIDYDIYLLKKAYSDEVKLENYRQSLRLEGFDTTTDTFDPSLLSKSDRQQMRSQLKKSLTRQQWPNSGR